MSQQFQNDALFVIGMLICLNIAAYIIYHDRDVKREKVKRKNGIDLTGAAYLAIRNNIDLYCPNCALSQLEEHLFCDNCETQYTPDDIRQQLIDYLDDLNEREIWLSQSEGVRTRWQNFVVQASAVERARRNYKAAENASNTEYITCEFCDRAFDVVNMYCPHCNTPNEIRVVDLHNMYDGDNPNDNTGDSNEQL